MIGVYKITNTKNGKVYIGQSVDIKNRFKTHKKQLRENDHDNCFLQDDWNTYGEDSFTFEVVQKCRSAHLNEIEQHLIKEYDSTNREKGYNRSAGCGRDLSVNSWYFRGRTKGDSSIKTYGRDNTNYIFFKNDNGEMEYNSVCIDCDKECKQSFRAEILICPHLEKR